MAHWIGRATVAVALLAALGCATGVPRPPETLEGIWRGELHVSGGLLMLGAVMSGPATLTLERPTPSGEVSGSLVAPSLQAGRFHGRADAAGLAGTVEGWAPQGAGAVWLDLRFTRPDELRGVLEHSPLVLRRVPAP